MLQFTVLIALIFTSMEAVHSQEPACLPSQGTATFKFDAENRTSAQNHLDPQEVRRTCEKFHLKASVYEKETPSFCNAYADFPPDGRRCVSAGVYQGFRQTLGSVLTKTPTTRSGYTKHQIRQWLQLIESGCSKAETVADKLSCIEQSGHAFFAKARNAYQKLAELKIPLSAKQLCATFKEAGLPEKATALIGSVAQAQSPPPGSKPGDYPYLVDCRGQDFEKTLKGCADPASLSTQALEKNAVTCLSDALDRLGEKKRDNEIAPTYFAGWLAELRHAGLELSVWGRLCVSKLRAQSLWDGSTIDPDQFARDRCLVRELAELRDASSLANWYDTHGDLEIALNQFHKTNEKPCEPPASHQDLKQNMRQLVKIVEDPNLALDSTGKDGKGQAAEVKAPEKGASRQQQEEERKTQEEIRKALATPIKPKPPFRSAKTRSAKELEAEARRVLEDFKAGAESKSETAQFLIDSEAEDASAKISQEKYNAHQKTWAEIEAEAKAIAADPDLKDDPEKKVERIVKFLIQKSLRNYGRDFALLNDALEGAGSNCEAETKMIYSALKAAGLESFGDKRLALQLFADHVQLVVYDTKSKEVWDPLHGTITADLTGSLYAPETLYYAYLKGKNKDVPITADDLLIAKVPDENVNPSGENPSEVRSNSLLGLPKENSYFNDDEIPEFDTIHAPKGRKQIAFEKRTPRKKKTANGAENPLRRVAGVLDSEEEKKIQSTVNHFLRQEFKAGKIPFLVHTSFLDPTGAMGIMQQPKTSIYFQTQAEADRFKALSHEAQNSYLKKLNNQALEKLSQSKEFEELQALFSDPTRVKNITPERMQELETAKHLLNDLLLRQSANAWGEPYIDVNRETNELEANLKRFPELKQYIIAQKHLVKNVQKNPAAYLRLLGSLDKAHATFLNNTFTQTDDNLARLQASDEYEDAPALYSYRSNIVDQIWISHTPRTEKILKLLADPKAVTYKAPDQGKAERPEEGEKLPLEFETIPDGLPSKTYRPTEPARPGEKEKIANPEKAPITLPAYLLGDLVLAGRKFNPDLDKRVTPQFAEVYAKDVLKQNPYFTMGTPGSMNMMMEPPNPNRRFTPAADSNAFYKFTKAEALIHIAFLKELIRLKHAKDFPEARKDAYARMETAVQKKYKMSVPEFVKMLARELEDGGSPEASPAPGFGMGAGFGGYSGGTGFGLPAPPPGEAPAR